MTHLGHDVEFHHGLGQRVSICPEVGDEPQHGPVEGAIDLLQGGGARIVHVDDWYVTEEPLRGKQHA